MMLLLCKGASIPDFPVQVAFSDIVEHRSTAETKAFFNIEAGETRRIQMGQSGKGAICVGFDGSLKLEPACRQTGGGTGPRTQAVP